MLEPIRAHWAEGRKQSEQVKTYVPNANNDTTVDSETTLLESDKVSGVGMAKVRERSICIDQRTVKVHISTPCKMLLTLMLAWLYLLACRSMARLAFRIG